MNLNSKWSIYTTKAAKVLLNCPANMLPKSTLHKWIKIFSPIKGSGENISLKDYKALQKQNQKFKIDNKILRKATAIFAKGR